MPSPCSLNTSIRPDHLAGKSAKITLTVLPEQRSPSLVRWKISQKRPDNIHRDHLAGCVGKIAVTVHPRRHLVPTGRGRSGVQRQLLG